MTRHDEDWKARAQAAEAELAEKIVKDFERKTQAIASSTEPTIRKVGKMLVALGELLDSSVPISALAPAMERWTSAMERNGVPGSNIASAVPTTQGESHGR